GEWILGAEYPGITMVAAHDPLVGKFGSGNLADHVVGGDGFPVEFEFQMHLRRAGPEVVGERQRALPGAGHRGPAECREEWFGVGPGNREHRDFLDYDRF